MAKKRTIMPKTVRYGRGSCERERYGVKVLASGNQCVKNSLHPSKSQTKDGFGPHQLANLAVFLPLRITIR